METPAAAGIATPSRTRLPREVGQIVALAVTYFLLGRLGLTLATHHENATLIWPPTGLALAALVLYGRRLWPGLLFGALILNASIGTEIWVAFGIAVGNTLEAVSGSWLLERFRIDAGLSRLRDVLGFVLIGAFLCTTVSATIGVGCLYTAGAVVEGTAQTIWLDWWLGDAGGAIVVAPFLLVAVRGSPRWGPLLRRAETWVVFGLVGLSLALAFSGALSHPMNLLASFLPFPFLVWAGLRLGPRGAVTVSAVSSASVALATALGAGPFPIEAELLFTWAYSGTVGLVAVLLAAAIAERESADAARAVAVERQERLEQQLRHTQRLESLGVLAGGVAHDFNNLLVAVRSNAELLRDELDGPAEAVDMLDDIEIAAVQASGLCSQLLTYAGRSNPRMDAVGLPGMVEEMRGLIGSHLKGRTRLTVDYGADVPPVRGDPAQLRQIVMNLCLNASESIGDEEGTVAVRTRVVSFTAQELQGTFLHSDAPAGTYAVLEVEDDGPGMDEETLSRIFDPFFSTKFTGRGLGLATVHGIVRGHGGAIKVESEPGKGTLFRVLLAPSTEAEQPAGRAQSPTSAHQAAVLVADDDESVRRAVRRVLERSGFDVVVVNSGDDALDVVRRRGVGLDVVLLDVTMPGLDGREARRRILDLHPDLPVLLMSGYEAGGIDLDEDVVFIHKPFEADDLVAAVVAACPANPRTS